MNANNNAPENFSVTLADYMDAVWRLCEASHSIRMAAESHYMRRAKQIKLDEKPFEIVPLANAIAILRKFEEEVQNTRATFEIVDAKNHRLGDTSLRLVYSSAPDKTGE